MITTKYKDKIIKIPSKWEDVSTDKYLKLSNAVEVFKNMEMDQDMQEKLNNKVIRILTDLSEDEINNLDLVSYLKLKQALEFTNEDIPTSKSKTIIYKNLVIKPIDYEIMTIGQFADLQKKIGDKNVIETVANSVQFIKPKNIFKLRFKDQIQELPKASKIEIIKEMSCVDFNNLYVFFWSGLTKHLKTSARFLNLKAMKINLRVVGVGILYLLLWPITKLRKSRKQVN
jgi:hypothetical protein